jgi:TonB family protein
MKKSTLGLALCWAAMWSFGPLWAQSESDTSAVQIVVEEMPIWSGCQGLTGDEARVCTETSIATFVSKNTEYPKKARRKGIEGMVIVKFVVDRDGSVGDVTVLRGAHPLLDEEALRVTSSFPPFTAGRQRNKPVKVSYTMPFTFSLE